MSQWASRTRKLNGHYQSGDGGGDYVAQNPATLWWVTQRVTSQTQPYVDLGQQVGISGYLPSHILGTYTQYMSLVSRTYQGERMNFDAFIASNGGYLVNGFGNPISQDPNNPYPDYIKSLATCGFDGLIIKFAGERIFTDTSGSHDYIQDLTGVVIAGSKVDFVTDTKSSVQTASGFGSINLGDYIGRYGDLVSFDFTGVTYFGPPRTYVDCEIIKIGTQAVTPRPVRCYRPYTWATPSISGTNAGFSGAGFVFPRLHYEGSNRKFPITFKNFAGASDVSYGMRDYTKVEIQPIIFCGDSYAHQSASGSDFTLQNGVDQSGNNTNTYGNFMKNWRMY